MGRVGLGPRIFDLPNVGLGTYFRQPNLPNNPLGQGNPSGQPYRTGTLGRHDPNPLPNQSPPELRYSSTEVLTHNSRRRRGTVQGGFIEHIPEREYSQSALESKWHST